MPSAISDVNDEEKRQHRKRGQKAGMINGDGKPPDQKRGENSCESTQHPDARFQSRVRPRQ